MRNAYILAEQHARKNHFGNPGVNRMVLKRECEGVDWIKLAQDRFRTREQGTFGYHKMKGIY
jgi:hypothetical protein